MNTRMRKLIGTFLVITVLVIYVAAASAIYSMFLTGLPSAVLLAYFAIAGIGWALPAGLVIWWMQRPSPK